MRSVRSQLLVGLLVGLGVVSIIAGYGIFRSAREEANELIDYELRSVCISLPQSLSDATAMNAESRNFEGFQMIVLLFRSGMLTGSRRIIRFAGDPSAPGTGFSYY